MVKRTKKSEGVDSALATDADDAAEPRARGDDLGDEKHIQKQLKDLYDAIEAGFDAQDERYNKNLDFWDLYNSKLGPNQFYNGNSKIFIPITRNAVNARKTRFVNQLFPTSRRHMEAVNSDGAPVSSLTALLEHYVRKAKLRTQVAPPLLRNGDVEGHYHLYVYWQEIERDVTWKEDRPVQIEEPMGEIETVEGGTELLESEVMDDPDETIEDMGEETIVTGHPACEVIADADVLLMPETCDSILEALEEGGSVTILRRWREGKIKAMIRAGHIDKDAGGRLLTLMRDEGSEGNKDTAKRHVSAAGIHMGQDGEPYAIVYETFTKLDMEESDEDDEDEDDEDDEDDDSDAAPKLCMVYMAGGEPDDILSCKRNPYWSDRVPLLSAPVEKVAGAFKGVSQLEAVESIQYQANDAINEGMDSAAYALLPIIMTDPEKNPRTGSMILSLAAIWETSPESTKFAEFPDMWKDAFTIVSACKAEIYETLSVSPAKITQQASTKKLTQAEIANEQQVDMLSTADAVTVLEDEIFTPLLAMFIELDHQFRDKDITVRSFGNLGLRANMETIPPIQFDRRYQFTWMGVESSRNAQMIQQQIGAMNVVRTIPPQQYQGYRINMAPAISLLMENVFGSSLAPLIFEDVRSQLSMEPGLEDQLMGDGLDMPIHLMDNHQEHMATHIKALQKRAQELGEGADPKGNFRAHILKHQGAMAMQAQAQQQAMMPTQGPGGGAPRPGAQPGGGRPAQQPAGAIHKDKMQDPTRMPPASLPPGGVR